MLDYLKIHIFIHTLPHSLSLTHTHTHTHSHTLTLTHVYAVVFVCGPYLNVVKSSKSLVSARTPNSC